MKRFFGVTLGILTAMGGFVDIGDIVANSTTGARFGMSLAWAVVVGVIGIIVFAEMSGRVASVTKRAVFDLVREANKRIEARSLSTADAERIVATFRDLDAVLGVLAPDEAALPDDLVALLDERAAARSTR